jgi:multidrug efflux system membrane fusion protein
MVRRCLVILFATFGLAAIGGCRHSSSEVAPASPPAIPVSKPVHRQVTDYVEFTGRTSAVNAVDVRPQVTGYLVRMPFKEGADVKKGDLLFEIDPRLYQSQVDQAKGQLNMYRARLKLTRATYERDRVLARTRAISQHELDIDFASVQESQAGIESTRGALETARLNLGYTKITSPIDGQVSRYYLTLGNLVNQDQTLLTTVVSLDPIYVYFDMDQRTLIRINVAVNQGKIQLSPGASDVPVLMGLEGEHGFPHRGTVDFINNQINPSTGTIAVRGVFQNPRPKGGRRLLVPGMFVRIRLPLGAPHPALLVIDRAVGSDQGLKFVYVVDANNRIQYRRVQTGPLQEDGLRVIEKGLKAGDRVVVGGLQEVRPRMEVSPDVMAMPTLGGGGQRAPRANPRRPQPPPAGAKVTR